MGREQVRKEPGPLMKRAWFIGISLALALLAAIGIVQFRKPKPVFVEGKSVLSWALELDGPLPTAPAEHFFSHASEDIVPCLVQALKTKDPFLRKPVNALAPHLSDGTSRRLIRFFNPDEAHRLRSGAARALELMGPKAKTALPALGQALWDEDANISMRASFALASIGGETVPQLIRGLEAPNLYTRLYAIHGLSRIGADAHQAIPALISVLDDKSLQIAEQASHALSRIGPASVPKLIPVLKHPRATVRALAAGALAEMGPPAREACPQLIEALRGERDAMVRKRVIEALGKVRPSADTVVSALSHALKDEDSGVRAKAAEGLGRSPRVAEAAVPILIQALKDSNSDVRNAAIGALGSMGASAKLAIPNLAAMAADNEEAASLRAREALERIRGGALSPD
jgi:HEAT repeat protein